MPKRLFPVTAVLLSACWTGGVPTLSPDRQASTDVPVRGARDVARSAPSSPSAPSAPIAPTRDARPSPSTPAAGSNTATNSPLHALPGQADPESATAARAERSATEIEVLRDMDLMVPVVGITPAQIPDTYWSKRDGGRLHRAADIMAAKGTPVVSPVEGTVLRVGRNTTGGIVVYTTDTDRRFVFYHAHLERVADGLADGATLRQGDVLGYVGTTGNAPPNAPHLHFQVMRMPADGRYWEGMPVDARPYLTKTGKSR